MASISARFERDIEDGPIIVGAECANEREGSARDETRAADTGKVEITEPSPDFVTANGRPVLLDDLDPVLHRLFPDAHCCASLAVIGDNQSLPSALILIEDHRFWEREASTDQHRVVSEATRLEEVEVHFVPPHFIAKTTSGKIDREKTLTTWLACRSGHFTMAGTNEEIDIAQELLIQFPGLSSDRQIRKELNSMGSVVLKQFCIEHGILYSPGLTLERIRAAKAKTKQSQSEVFSIVALVDGSRLGFGALRPFFDDTFMNALSEVTGCPVHFEQICTPPVPILFSDLIFHDYFLAKHPDPAYRPVSSVLRKIKEASLILVDDEDNFRTPPFCSYPILNHQFLTHPDAELLGHRTQRYTQNHHKLPRGIVLGRQIKPESINPTLKDMENYLGTPIVKMAFHSEFHRYTEHWDFCDYRQFVSDAEKLLYPAWVDRFRVFLVEYIRLRAGQFRKRLGEPVNRFTLLDSPHFCSYVLNRSAVDFVTAQYDSFCIVGFPSSLPYLTQRLEQLGKRFCFCSQLTSAHEGFDCIILTGGTGTLPDQKPTFDFLHARKDGEGGGRPHNVSPEIEALCPSLTACDQQVFRELQEKIKRGQIGRHVMIGNFILNKTTATRASAA